MLLNEAVDAAAGTGLVAEVDFETVFKDENDVPRRPIPLATIPPPPTEGAGEDQLLWLHLPMAEEGTVAAFAPHRCEALFDPAGATPSSSAPPTADTEGGAGDEEGEEAPPTLRLLNPPHRARIGAELPMKVYPAAGAAMLGRWLWHHRKLLDGVLLTAKVVCDGPRS